MPYGPALLQVMGHIFGSDGTHSCRQGNFLIRSDIQEERLGRAGDLAMPALDAYAGFRILNPGQGVLIRGINDGHRADDGADPAPGAEILIDKYRGHVFFSLT
jgi:hypothetical protein